jgi:hypothetical protein
MITLPSHTSHALQPLDASCFKPFKTTLKNKGNNSMVNNNYKELDKIALVNWVDKALDETLSQKKSRMGLRLHGFGLEIQRLWMARLNLMNCTLQKTTSLH